MYNFKLANADTDSIMFCKPDGSEFSNEEKFKLLQDLNFIMPEFIEWNDDGYFSNVIIFKSKNYVLFNGKDKITKGSSIKDAKKEPALREMVDSIIDVLLDDADITKCVSIYNQYVKEAMNIQDITRWSVKKTITDKILTGERTNETKVKDALGSDNFQEGDKVWVYTAIDGMKQDSSKGQLLTYADGTPKMVENCILKQSKKWNNDEDKLHYVERVYDTVSILKTVLDINQFPKYHLKKNRHLMETL